MPRLHLVLSVVADDYNRLATTTEKIFGVN